MARSYASTVIDASRRRGLGAHPRLQRPRHLARRARRARARSRTARAATRSAACAASRSTDGTHLRERLLSHSDVERAYSYDFQKTPFDVDNYHATIRVTPVTDGSEQLRRVVDDVRLRPRPAGALDGLLRHPGLPGRVRRAARRTSATRDAAPRVRVAGQAEPISHFTDAVQAGELLFVSGIVPVDEQPRARRRRRRRRAGALRVREHARRCSPRRAARSRTSSR